MKQDHQITAAPADPVFSAQTFQGLAPMARDLNKLKSALDNLQDLGDEASDDAIRKLRRQMRDFEPAVTLIGQVKAGKTTLVNAMTGHGDLLPSDINPWTSVVTSLHLSPTITKSSQHAQFRFFTEEEWSHLLNTGGRVGELASRAGADKELEKVRAQLAEMRATSRKRLGAGFEMLLGQTHDYGYVDPELVQRYVCLGDDFGDDTSADKSQGRFADITRSADLHLGMPGLPVPLCLRDTPGVNDTFMVREQITVKAIRGSRLCVVVLSAHQALSLVDLALIRLIANVPSRDVIIFVNRIDELDDPARAVPEIHESIRRTLKSQNISPDTKVIFGSAIWAQSAQSGNLASMDKASIDSLLNWAKDQASQRPLGKDPLQMVWDLSGLPALGRAIAERIVTGEGAALMTDLVNKTRNVASAIAASRAMVDRRIVEGHTNKVDGRTLTQAIDQIAESHVSRLEKELEQLLSALDERLGKTRQTFAARATTALIEHLDTYGEEIEWRYDPAGLRLLLKSGYHVFTTKAATTAGEALRGSSIKLKDLFSESFDLLGADIEVTPPVVPDPPPPVMLGQTIALDIKGSWWTRWWRRRRSYDAYAEEFKALIDAEIAPMASALKADHAAVFKAALTSELDAFIATQRSLFLSLADKSQADLKGMRQQQSQAASEIADSLNAAMSILSDFRRPDIRKATP